MRVVELAHLDEALERVDLTLLVRRLAHAENELHDDVALALLGVPLTAGFVSKWLMLQAAWDSGALLGVIVFAVSSLLAVAYVARIVLPIWQHSDNTQPIITPPTIRLAMLLTTAAALIFGVWPGPVIELCQRAAEALL